MDFYTYTVPSQNKGKKSAFMPSKYHAYAPINRLWTFITDRIILAMYILVNVGSDNWRNWDTPYETLFFHLHLALYIMDQFHRSSENWVSGTLFLTPHQLQLSRIVAWCTLYADAFAVGRHASLVQRYNGLTVDDKVQLAFLCWVMFMTLVRLTALHLRTSVSAVATSNNVNENL